MFVLNKIILSVALSVGTTQSIKAIRAYLQNHKFHIRYLFMDAGMPSSHTATVTSLAAATYLAEGFTTLFIALVVLALVVIKNVLGDKVFAKHQEKAINRMINDIKEGKFEPVAWGHLTGHTLKEVITGMSIALAITLGVFYLIP